MLNQRERLVRFTGSRANQSEQARDRRAIGRVLRLGQNCDRPALPDRIVTTAEICIEQTKVGVTRSVLRACAQFGLEGRERLLEERPGCIRLATRECDRPQQIAFRQRRTKRRLELIERGQAATTLSAVAKSRAMSAASQRARVTLPSGSIPGGIVANAARKGSRSPQLQKSR